MRKDKLSDGEKNFKKTKITSKQRVEYWVIPPKANAEFAAAMERTIATYQTPYDAKTPVVCMDEQPISLHADRTGREPIAETVNHCKRVDYQYERKGTASIFMFVEPLTGLRGLLLANAEQNAIGRLKSLCS